jgi:hypothetical protein
VQHRQGVNWQSRSHCRAKESLLRCCGYDPHPALAALPDRIGDHVAPATGMQAVAIDCAMTGDRALSLASGNC